MGAERALISNITIYINFNNKNMDCLKRDPQRIK